MLASSESDAPVGGPEGGARPFCASVSSPRNQSSGGWVQNSLVPDSYFLSAFCCAPAWVIPRLAIPAMARTAAHASMDRLKADFIASLPMQPDWLRLLFIFERCDRRTSGLVPVGRALNATTSEPREKRVAPPCNDQGRLRRNFFHPSDRDNF